MSDNGGAPSALTTVAPTEVSHSWPQFLPDGRHFLYWVQARDADPEKSGVMVGLGESFEETVKQHKTLKGISPAMAAGLVDRIMKMDDIVGALDAENAPKLRGPYKPRAPKTATISN